MEITIDQVGCLHIILVIKYGEDIVELLVAFEQSEF